MAQKRISDLPLADALTGEELVEGSQLSGDVTITAATISAAATDNSFSDSANGFVDAGFAVGDRVNVVGFGSSVNNLFVGILTTVAADKLTIGGMDGEVIVDEASGASVTISKWTSVRTTTQDIADLGGGGSASFPDFTGNAGKVLAVNATEDDVEWIANGTGASGGTVGSHRYWALANWSAHQNRDGIVGGSGLELRATVGGSPLAVSSSEATDTLSGYPTSNLFDADTATLWTSEGGTNPMLVIDLGVESEVREFAWIGRNDSFWYQSPRAFDVFYSDDGDNWNAAGRVFLPAQTAANQTTVGKLVTTAPGGSGKPWYWNPPLAATWLTPADFIGDGSVPSYDDDADVGLLIYTPVDGSGSGSDDKCRFYLRPIPNPSEDWSVEWYMNPECRFPGDYPQLHGICLVDTAKTKNIQFGWDLRSVVYWGRFNIPSGYGGAEQQQVWAKGAPRFWKVEHISATSKLRFYASENGKIWSLIRETDDTDWFGETPKFIGLGMRMGSTNLGYVTSFNVEMWNETNFD